MRHHYASHLMPASALGCALWILGALLSSQSPARAQTTSETRPPAATPLEEIYIAHSVPESRSAPTDFCAKDRIGFGGATFEGQFTFRSTAVEGSDGRMTDTNAKTIGDIHLCFGPSSDPGVTNFYGEGLFGGVPYKGIGDCRRRKANFPEQGLNLTQCFLDLSGLPSSYVGGVLTTNTLTSRKGLGMETDPPGYTQVSIATIRLWKKRAER